MSKTYISLVNNQDCTKSIVSGKTKVFYLEEEASKFAIEMRSYCFPAIEFDEETGEENKVYCVPK